MKIRLKSNYKICLALAIVFIVCCAFAMTTARVSAGSIAELTMVKGASVRIKTDSNGLRFMATMTDSDYEAIENENVSYGMLIAPKNYTDVNALTEENVFGASAVYDWAIEDGLGNWVYSGTKTRIINIAYETLPLYEGERVIRGSITNLKEGNIDREFVGRAYIKYFDGTNYSYIMADYAEDEIANNTRTMFYVAAAAIDLGSSDFTLEEQENLRNSYIRKVSQNAFNSPLSKGVNEIVDVDLPSGASRANKYLTNFAYYDVVSYPIDLNKVSEIKFYVKTLNSSWILLSVNQSQIAGSETQSSEWVEYKFVNEGFGYLQFYFNGAWRNFKIINNFNEFTINLGDNGEYLFSNLIVKTKEVCKEIDAEYTALANYNLASGDSKFGSASTETIDLPSNASSITYSATGVWDGVGYPLKNLDLSDGRYTSLKFYLRKDDADTSRWLEFKTGGGSNNNPYWQEFLLVRNGASNYTYTLYSGSTQLQSDITDISNIHVSFYGGYRISELLVCEDSNYVNPYSNVADFPFTISNGTASSEVPVGYTKSTSVTTSWNKYYFTTLDLTPYSEVKFSEKSSGYYGMMYGGNVIGETDGGGNWIEMKLTKSGSQWILTYTGVEQGTYTLSNNNITDFNFRFGDATYLVTEIIGKADPDYVNPYSNVADFPFTISNGTASSEVPVGYTKSTSVTTSWNIYYFTTLDLTPYSEVKFSVKSSGYYGMMYGGNVIGETDGGGNWIEMKLTKSGSQWILTYNGVEQGTYTLSNNNITDFNFRFGSNTYLVTEIIGKADFQ